MKSYRILTYGCQSNRSDSERIASVLEGVGYQLTDKNPELVIVNMCSIRQSAVDRARAQLDKIRLSGTKTILTGCIIEKDRKLMNNSADLVLDIKDLPKWPEILGLTKNIDVEDYFGIHPKYQNGFSAFIPIINGCDNFCTYCVVPHTRGREQSRRFNEIMRETKTALRDGCKEVWFLGQNVNSYKDESFDLSHLLKNTNSIPGDFWISFLSSHPKDLDKKIIETMNESEKVTDYLNLPVQSGDDAILRKMNRPYSVSEYRKSVEIVMNKLPEVTLSTDVIVGFPGESDRAFNNTVRLFEDLKFDMAYISKYSPRPGTLSYKMKDDVPYDEKSRRFKVLTEIVASTALEKNKKLEGKEELVLVQEKSKGLLVGKTKRYKTVRLKGSEQSIGSFVNVKIEKALPWGLRGSIK